MVSVPKATTFVFLGRPGCGKDTQIEFLLQRDEWREAVKIMAGDLFRELSEKDSALGRKVKEILDKGGLPPLWLASFLWISQLVAKVKGEEILLFGGSPRRRREAELLDEVLEFMGRPKAVAVVFVIRREESLKRLLLRGRHDDSKERIQNRLSWFESDVIPAIGYYREDGRLVEVDGEKPREAVFEELLEKLESYFQ